MAPNLERFVYRVFQYWGMPPSCLSLVHTPPLNCIFSYKIPDVEFHKSIFVKLGQFFEKQNGKFYTNTIFIMTAYILYIPLRRFRFTFLFSMEIYLGSLFISTVRNFMMFLKHFSGASKVFNDYKRNHLHLIWSIVTFNLESDQTKSCSHH